jgi:histidinol-phosphate phosphatase family protein
MRVEVTWVPAPVAGQQPIRLSAAPVAGERTHEVGTDVRRAVFLDRDGVISENRENYVTTWEEFAFLPDVFEPLQRLAESPFAVVVISNQSAVGRGLLTLDDLKQIHRRMKEEIEHHGGRIDTIEYCPHRPEDSCECRKPLPGMLLSAARDLELVLSESYVVGDAQTDVEAAINAGCAAVMVRTGRGEEQLATMPDCIATRCRVVDDLRGAVDWILGPGRDAALGG